MAVKLVLIADQDESRLNVLQQTIAQSKRAALTATTASECLALRLLFRPDLVIVEAGMANSSRVIERLLERPLDPEIAYIINRSHGQPANYFLLAMEQMGEPAVLLRPGEHGPKLLHADLLGSLHNGQSKRANSTAPGYQSSGARHSQTAKSNSPREYQTH